MGELLKQIRDLTIIIGIYLYFIAWVYVHFYYEQFGISTESVKIDYNSYLMYSYNVVTSAKFLFWIKILLWLIVVWLVLRFFIVRLEKRYIFFRKLRDFFSENALILYGKKLNKQYSLLLLIVILLIIFPFVFKVSRQVAIDNYYEDRRHTANLKTIQFIFRKDADLMSPTVVLDSSLSKSEVFYSDISLIKNDPQQLLRLLAESDKYYIVLHQRPFNKMLGALPSGYVYYIDKKDILLSKIILRSL